MANLPKCIEWKIKSSFASGKVRCLTVWRRRTSMHNGEDLVVMYERKYKINMVGRSFLVELIDTALKEVFDDARDDVMRVAKKLAADIIKEGEITGK
jgi:hypothetical protein